jgi:hypothetical protein
MFNPMLQFTDAEAKTLAIILNNVGGSPETSLRLHADAILERLVAQVPDTRERHWLGRGYLYTGQGIHFRDNTLGADFQHENEGA